MEEYQGILNYKNREYHIFNPRDIYEESTYRHTFSIEYKGDEDTNKYWTKVDKLNIENIILVCYWGIFMGTDLKEVYIDKFLQDPFYHDNKPHSFKNRTQHFYVVSRRSCKYFPIKEESEEYTSLIRALKIKNILQEKRDC